MSEKINVIGIITTLIGFLVLVFGCLVFYAVIRYSIHDVWFYIGMIAFLIGIVMLMDGMYVKGLFDKNPGMME